MALLEALDALARALIAHGILVALLRPAALRFRIAVPDAVALVALIAAAHRFAQLHIVLAHGQLVAVVLLRK